jgi:uncharacterized repeat protein (TIGR03803 family)
MKIASGKILLLFICIIAAATPLAAANFRVVSYLSSEYTAPLGITEGYPGIFFSESSGMTLFDVTSQGAVTTVASFSSPAYQLTGPGTTAANGLFYSSVQEGINGTVTGSVFSVSAKPGIKNTYPTPNVILLPIVGNLPDGRLYAVGYVTGVYNLSTVDLVGNVTTFYQFPGTDQPAHPIYAGGSYHGLVSSLATGVWTTYFYSVTPLGAFTKIATLPFVTTGLYGADTLVQGSDGNFYGIQPEGLQASQHGAIFKLTPSGQFTILHDFGSSDMPTSLIVGSDGRLWGTELNRNVLFSLTRTGTYKGEFEMNGSDGLCPCSLVQGSDGNIYGSAEGGGPQGLGVIFALDAELPVPKPEARAFHPASGAPGTRVRIWGHNLFDSSVSFNGVPAGKAVSAGPNYVWVDVPVGATTGPITVTTAGGASTTREIFTVN